MGTPANRVVALIDRIAALDLRMQDHMRDPSLDPSIKNRMAYLHAQWRDLLLENMAAIGRRHVLAQDWCELEAANTVQMERMMSLLRSLKRDAPDKDS